MTDLRIRISTAIMDSCHGVYLDDAVAAADAVMAVVSDEYVNSRGMFHEPDRCLGCEECADA